MLHLKQYKARAFFLTLTFITATSIIFKNVYPAEAPKSNAPPRPPTQAELEKVMKKISPETFELRNMVQGGFKIVWCRDFSKSSSMDVPNKTLRLMRFTRDSLSDEDMLLSDYADYCYPMFTTDGEKVIFSRYTPRIETYMVSFDGSQLQQIAKGLAIGIIFDDKTKQEWLYTAQLEKGTFLIVKAIYRQIINSTNVPELVWDKIPLKYCSVNSPYFIGASLPLNICGYVNLKEDRFVKVEAYGRFPAFLPGNSDVFSYLELSPRKFSFFDVEAKRKWQVPFDSVEEIGVYGVSHIKWSNRYPFFVFTAPYLVNDRTGELDIISGSNPKVYVGQLSSDCTRVLKAIPITSGKYLDLFPAMWVAPATASKK
jgi:hypothetical protein